MGHDYGQFYTAMDAQRVEPLRCSEQKERRIMDPIENSRAVARELVSIARDQQVDLEPFGTDGHFLKDQRSIFLWRKDELPCSGPVNEPLGTLHNGP